LDFARQEWDRTGKLSTDFGLLSLLSGGRGAPFGAWFIKRAHSNFYRAGGKALTVFFDFEGAAPFGIKVRVLTFASTSLTLSASSSPALNSKLPQMMVQMLVHQYRPFVRR
jgi:hypothetical protein